MKTPAREVGAVTKTLQNASARVFFSHHRTTFSCGWASLFQTRTLRDCGYQSVIENDVPSSHVVGASQSTRAVPRIAVLVLLSVASPLGRGIQGLQVH